MRNCAFFIFFRQKLSPLRRRTVQERTEDEEAACPEKFLQRGQPLTSLPSVLRPCGLRKSPSPESTPSAPKSSVYAASPTSRKSRLRRTRTVQPAYPISKAVGEKDFPFPYLFFVSFPTTLPKSNLGCIHRPVTRNSELNSHGNFCGGAEFFPLPRSPEHAVLPRTARVNLRILETLDNPTRRGKEA